MTADLAERPIRNRWLLPALIASAVAVVIIIGWSVVEAGNDQLSAPEALLLGIIEGITEYLPVSSTGHLTVTQDLLGLTETDASKDAADSYAIAIQFGAIVAVAFLYRVRIMRTVTSLVRPVDEGARDEARCLASALVVAFVPAAAVGFLAGDWIKEQLFGIPPTAAAWFVGGLAILAFARWHRPGERTLEMITTRDGLIIGIVQILALWPGVSRSLVTIIAAAFVGFRIVAAVEFSFLLGLATLTAATLYETATNGSAIVDQYGYAMPLLGFAAALVSAAAAVMWMVGYLERRSLAIFGWYRLGIAVVAAVLSLTVL